MRLFICLILFVLFHSCESDKVEYAKEESLPYQIEWLNDQHVKVQFDSSVMIKEQLLITFHLSTPLEKIKSLEISADSIWLETFSYNIEDEKFDTKSEIYGYETSVLKNNTEQNDSLILNTNLHLSKQLEKTSDRQREKINNVRPDRLIIKGGKPHVMLSLNKDSITIIRRGTKIIATLPQITPDTEWQIVIPDTIPITGKITNSLLDKITEAVNLIDLVEVSGDSLFNSSVGYSTHTTGHSLIIYENEKTYTPQKHRITTGIRKLIKIARHIKQEDLL